MTTTVNTNKGINELQGWLILKRQWLNRPTLSLAYNLRKQHPNVDLCAILGFHGLLEAPQIETIRKLSYQLLAEREAQQGAQQTNPSKPTEPTPKTDAPQQSAPQQSGASPSPQTDPGVHGNIMLELDGNTALSSIYLPDQTSTDQTGPDAAGPAKADRARPFSVDGATVYTGSPITEAKPSQATLEDLQAERQRQGMSLDGETTAMNLLSIDQDTKVARRSRLLPRPADLGEEDLNKTTPQKQAATAPASGAIPPPVLGNDPSASEDNKLLMDTWQSFVGNTGEIGTFKILGEISRGGMAMILRGVDKRTKQPAAIKFNLFNNAEDVIRRFTREIDTLSTFQHRNLPMFYESGLHNGLFYYAMELIPGPTLKELTDTRFGQSDIVELDTETVLVFLKQIAEAVDYCHRRGIIHRDLKPQNVVIDRVRNRAVLIDFGVLKPVQHTQIGVEMTQLTKTGDFIGTPAYMAPEQIDPSKRFGPICRQSDAWAFGVMSFYAFTGRLPFVSENIVDLINEITEGQFPSVREFDPSLPSWLDSLIQQCLLLDATERPSFSDIVECIEDGLKSPLVQAQSTKSWFLPVMVVSMTGLMMALVLGLSLLFANLTPTLHRFPQAKCLESPTNKPEARLVGEFSKANGMLRVSRKTNDHLEIIKNFRAGATGQFEVSVPLRAGTNVLQISAVESQCIPVEITVVQDRGPPTISFLSSNLNRGRINKLQTLEIAGLLKDVSRCTLRVNNSEVTLDSDGSFVFKVPDKKAIQTLVFEAQDSFGFQSRVTVKVTTPAYETYKKEQARRNKIGSESRKRWGKLWLTEHPLWTFHTQSYWWIVGQQLNNGLKVNEPPKVERRRSLAGMNREQREAEKQRLKLWGILGNLNQWRLASRSERTRIIDMVRRRLGPKYSLKRTRTTKRASGLPGYRMVTFKHDPSGIEFNLIPGGSVSFSPSNMDLKRFEKAFYMNGPISPENAPERVEEFVETLKIMSDRVLAFLKLQKILGLPENSSTLECVEHLRKRPELLRDVKEALTTMRNMRSGGGNDNGSGAQPQAMTFKIPAHLMATTETTVAQWARIKQQNPPTDNAFHPQTQVTVQDIKRVLKSSPRAEGLRLPYHCEWIYDCLAGDTIDSWTPRGLKIWDLKTSHSQLDSVDGPRSGNAFALRDMLGNAEEFCLSAWQAKIEGRVQALWPVTAGGHCATARFMISPQFHRISARNQGTTVTGFRFVAPIP